MKRTPSLAFTRKNKRQETPQSKKFANVAIIGLSSLLVFGVGVAVVDQGRSQSRVAEAAESYTPAVVLAPPAPKEKAPPSAEMETAIAALKDRSKPWTMTVIGDSTGNDPKEWVRLVVADLANKTGRPVQIHTWDPETNSYGDVTEVSGQGEPIILWNGSASGKKGAYSLEHIDEMAPERPDLFVINHGHNQVNTGDATNETSEIRDWATSQWDEAPTVAVTLQNPSYGEREDRQAGVVRALRSFWGKQDNVVLIDTWSAFEDADDVDSLLVSDKLHPSEAGSRVWADAAWKALSFDSV